MNITITEREHWDSGEYNYPMPDTLIKLNYKNKKRLYAKMLRINKSSPYEHTMTLKMGYKPAPKSTLRERKSFFTKFKMPIYA